MHRSSCRHLAVAVLLATLAPLLLKSPAQPCSITVEPGASLQRAISRASEGAVICLPEGEWKEHLIISKSLTLRGETAWMTRIRGREMDVPVIRVMAPGETQVVVALENLTVTGGRTMQVGYIRAYGLGLEGSVDVTIRDSTIAGNDAYGIFMTGSSRATITGTTITGNLSYGVRMQDSSHAIIESSTIGWNRKGIVMSDAAKATVVGSNIERHAMSGVIVRGRAEFSIRDSTISENGDAELRLESSGRAEVIGSTIRGKIDKDGIVMWHSSHIRIADSAVEGNAWGIWMRDTARATIEGSNLRANAWGLGVWDSAQAIVANSTIEEHMKDGIVLGHAAGLALEQARIIRNEGYGLSLLEQPCFAVRLWFTGHVSGSGNIIPGPHDEDGNLEGAVCPPVLAFLMTEEGGELDRTEQSPKR